MMVAQHAIMLRGHCKMRTGSVFALLASAAPRILLSFSFFTSKVRTVHTAPLGSSDTILRNSGKEFSWSANRLHTKVNAEMDSETYDLAVIGGGPGGLAAANEAARLGSKTILFDYARHYPNGNRRGLGGTCVNVGCIPKKIMHYAALLGHSEHDRVELGFAPAPRKHDWNKMVQTVRNYVSMLNFCYRAGLMTNKVTYVNAYARLVDKNVIEYTDKEGTKQVKAKNVILAVGEVPSVPQDVKGAREYAITSDKLFTLPKPVGKTLVVGASYVALECAGFLTGVGFDVTVAVRSILLRGFDRQCAEKVGELMEATGTKFRYQVTPTEVKKLENEQLEITFSDGSTEVFDTLLYATGRVPESSFKELRQLGVQLSNSGHIITDHGKTSVEGIFAVGDIVEGNPALATVAVKEGELLARRMFGNSTRTMDLEYIPIAIYTPFEYGSCGLSEEAAKEKYGEIEVYLKEFTTLELAAVHRVKHKNAQANEEDIYMPPNCLSKLVCLKDDTVVGIHFVGPNAGEIIQGMALALRRGLRKEDFDNTMSVHPTDAESFMGLTVTKSSGESWVATGGCGGGRCG